MNGKAVMLIIVAGWLAHTMAVSRTAWPLAPC